MQLKHLLEGVNIINSPKNLDQQITAVCYSASKCVPDSLFVAIKGLQYDGHDFVREAVTKGARCIVCENDVDLSPTVTKIKVESSRDALGIIAKNFFGNPSESLVLIGVIGTSGKTTITYLLESIFKEAGISCGVLGTVNYRYKDKIIPAPNTTPESYEMHKILREMNDEGITHAIAEVSSHALDLRRVDSCDFDFGIFTNLTSEHLDYHVTMENYFQAKKRFFSEVLPQSNKKVSYRMIVNGDDNWGRRILKEVSLPSLAFGEKSENAVRPINCDLSLAGIKAQIDLAGEKIAIESELIGKFNLHNILAAMAAAKNLGISSAEIKAGIKKLSRIPGRLEKINSHLGFNVFVDYAHKADALQQVLENLSQFKKKRLITVFGCGGNRDRGKRPLMGNTATSRSDFTIVTSDNPRQEDPLAIIDEIEAGIDQQKVKKLTAQPSLNGDAIHAYMIVPERREAITMAINLAQKDDIVLIAGKGHEDYQIIGTKKISFDDRIIASEALNLRSNK